MRAAYYEKNGPAREVLQLGEVETPRPAAGEVRVRLATSGLNPSDVKTRAGLIRKMAYPRVIPNSDGAGEIDMVGDGVAQSRIGERVWVWNGQWQRPFGTSAEYIALPQNQVVRLPATTSFEAGACLGVPAMTAYQAVALSGVGEGSTVLIAGGAGAVPNYAIQFAKKRGAKVVTTVSSPIKADVARRAGADVVIDYKTENVGERVMAATAKKGVDAVIELDLTANASLLPAVLRPLGMVVIYGTQTEANIPSQFFLANDVTLKYFGVYRLAPADRERAIADITRALERDELIHNVAATPKLDDVVAAHEALEQGKVIGKLVLRIA